MATATGLLNLHYAGELGLLTSTRGIASTSVLGRFAFMDFPLSNFVNSGIDRNAILVKKHLRSIIQHVGENHIFTLNSKLGGLSLLYDEPFATNSIYNHDINNLIENHWFLDSIPDDIDVVVIAPAHIIYKYDFRPLIEEHVKNQNKISVLYHRTHHAKSTFIGEDVIHFDINHNLTKLTPNLGVEDEENIFLQTLILDKEVLRGFIQLGKKTSSLYNLRDVLLMVSRQIPVHCYNYNGTVRCFDSLKHYLEYSIEFIKSPSLQEEFFNSNWPIYTKSYDTPPAKFGPHSRIQTSYVANGSQIDGTVINSIISRDVVIKAGAVIKNSVILSNSYISESTHLENVVCDKQARVIHVKSIIGTEDNVEFIKRGDIA